MWISDNFRSSQKYTRASPLITKNMITVLIIIMFVMMMVTVVVILVMVLLDGLPHSVSPIAILMILMVMVFLDHGGLLKCNGVASLLFQITIH